MGFYLPRDKAEAFLANYGQKISPTIKWEEIPKGKIVVVLVDKGSFKAATIAYSESELEVFKLPRDVGLKTFYLVPINEVISLMDNESFAEDLRENGLLPKEEQLENEAIEQKNDCPLDMEFIRSACLEILLLLPKCGISPISNGTYCNGGFGLEIMLRGDAIVFWRSGQRDAQEASFRKECKSLTVAVPERTTILSSDSNPQIKTIVKERPLGETQVYPNFEFEWTGVDKDNVTKGTLTYIRVNISGSQFVNYQKNYSKEGYRNLNATHANLASFNLPENLDGVESLLGEPIEKNINFDEKVKEIIEVSGLKEFLEELRFWAK